MQHPEADEVIVVMARYVEVEAVEIHKPVHKSCGREHHSIQGSVSESEDACLDRIVQYTASDFPQDLDICFRKG